jgi:ABC-type phosphate transport system substrate-binding protein
MQSKCSFLAQGLKSALIFFAVVGLHVADAADYVLIVNKDNSHPVDKEFFAKVYKGAAKSWPDGGSVVAYDLPDDNATRTAFYNDVVGKTPAQVRSMWASLTFSGKALPPKSAANDADIVAAVAANKSAIGYVSGAPSNGAVKTVK